MTTKAISRREFLERLGILGGLAALYYGMPGPGLFSTAQADTGRPELEHHAGEGQHIVILGAGVAGLCAAYLLRNTGFKVTIVEPNPHVGGRCFTLRKGDLVAEEGTDRQGNPFKPLICDFDAGPDFYFNAGPGRIPQNHKAILYYCKKLKITLQPYIFACRSNLLQNDEFNQGKPIPLRWVKHDLRGYIAEFLAHSVRSGQIDRLVTPGDREAFLKMLQHFGSLEGSDQSLIYRGTSRGGYRQKPGAGPNAGILRPQFELKELLDSKFWEFGLFNDMYLYWQTSLMQPEGGMDNIPKAFQNHLGSNTKIQLNVKAVGISRTADKIIIKLSSSAEPIRADFCLSTMAPPLLSRILDSSFSKKFRKSLASIYMVPSFKLGWQAKRRFWEEENEIYGGISWTKHIIAQLWYPSYGFHSRKGVLTGAYNYGRAAGKFGLMPHTERMLKALNGGEKFHPGLFERNVEKGISIAWQNMPNQAGGWAYYRNQAANPEYLAINQPQGRLVLAGDYLSFISGWMEGAVRSAELAVERIAHPAISSCCGIGVGPSKARAAPSTSKESWPSFQPVG
ncbi:MAG: FAD-dependent oxidoreductase, partial [Deltaproteobacteria bacterium]|nr:FAD-dependent oxidoreductase [Deltaproteobacteria bacterium]